MPFHHSNIYTTNDANLQQCDVLVASFDATVLRTMGVKIIEDLWTNGISAELAVDASSLEELMAKYREHNHRWIVIAKQDSKERGYKVRNLVRKEEFDIRSSELVPWLRAEVHARHQREGISDPRLPRQASQQDALLSSEKANDVRILVPQHRSKKTNRRNIVESGMSFLDSYPPATYKNRALTSTLQLCSALAKSPRTPATAPSPQSTPATTSSTRSATRDSPTQTAGAQSSRTRR